MALTEELERLRADNRMLAGKLVELANNPPVVIRPEPAPPPPAIDIAAILDQFRRTVSPDITIPDRPDAPDEQRRGINWSDQGLDNTGGTPETIRDLFDTPPQIPDYVLDVESMTADQVKGSRGGWYNPPKPT